MHGDSEDEKAPEGAGMDAMRDGRQSARAAEIARGVMRVLDLHGLRGIAELTLASGRRADIAALNQRGDIWIVEIKSSIEDFRSDQKWPEYRDYCDRLFFAVAPDFPQELIPDTCGLVVADRYGGEIVRQAGEHRLAPARRKAVTLLLARVAAGRLMTLADPERRYEPLPRQ